MLRKPVFWVSFVALSIVAWWFTLSTFEQAYPVVDLELTMNRSGALAKAEDLASRHGWGPPGATQAVAFERDETVQVFVELEAGGKAAFQEMLAADLYAPYSWKVRRFQPGHTTQGEVRFTPDGEPYGFRIKLPEDAPGASLEPAAARRLAEDAAAGDWRVHFADFELIEGSQEMRPGGRTDHTFVYQRQAQSLGEARYRLRLVVSGDQLSELSHSVAIPETFHRRLAQLRAGNQALSSAGRIVMLVLLLGGGCLTGLLFLLRRRALLWRQALVWGATIGLLQLMAGLNRWPLWWMEYDTAVGAKSFVIETIFNLFSECVWLTLGTAFVFMAAEGLTRYALPDQIQLWRSASAAASPQILGRTAAAYLLVGPYCAYKVAFFLFTSQNLGWWSPASHLSDPNILATWLPWLNPIAAALRAGFAEECLFRALPLAIATLLGRRFGQPRLWIGATLILQAVIFGASHANYPNLPAHARLVELILPSILYGLIYLRFGLLPGILLHFAFDVLAFGLPVLVSTAPGAAIHLTMLALITLLPMAVVLLARWRQGRWGEVDGTLLNGSWVPPPATAETPGRWAPSRQLDLPGYRWLYVAAAAGAALWLATSRFESDAPRLQVDRSTAITAARQEAQNLGWELSPHATVLGQVRFELDDGHRFVWQQGGRQLYDSLLGSYLRPPRWHFRFVNFSGEVTGRAEEHQIWIDGRGQAFQHWHRLPEDRDGANLEAGNARTLALAALASRYGLGPDQRIEISALPSQRPSRRDWQFTFEDPTVLPETPGKALATVLIAGHEVISSFRQIQPPESWRRAEREHAAIGEVLHQGSRLCFFLVCLGGLLAAVYRWSQRRLAGRGTILSLTLLSLLAVVILIDLWPLLQAELSTSRAPGLQMTAKLKGILPPAIGILVAVALQIGFTLRWPPLRTPKNLRAALLPGLALGTVWAGLAALVLRLRPSSLPIWPDFTVAGSALPWLGASLHPLATFFIVALPTVWIVVGADHLTAGWQRRRGLAALLMIGLAIGFTGWSVDDPSLWFWQGLLLGGSLLAAYILVLRHQLSLVVPAVAGAVAWQTLGQGILRAYPGALLGNLLAVVVILLVALWWVRALADDTMPAARSVEAESAGQPNLGAGLRSDPPRRHERQV